MNEQQKTSISKLLSLVLRHQPATIGLSLDEGGWADIAVLLDKLAAYGKPLLKTELLDIVHTNNKQRFAFSEDGLRIRANQGHSINVELQLMPVTPPAYLYHGTVERSLASILAEGLQKMKRQHVHLSADVETATIVGSRRGQPVILKVDSAAMHSDGLVFYLSGNKVWLTDAVPAQYIIYKN